MGLMGNMINLYY